MESAPQYLHLAPGTAPPALVQQPTRVVVVLDQPVEPEWQHLASRWLIEAGCLYMLAWGPSYSSWDDSVDLANLEAFDYTDIPEESDAMTTWHADEPVEECMWFAKNCAMHSVAHLERTIILHIGPAAREHELVGAYAEA
nr:putative integron gene cassette protein [uncultured bacterium]